ncbi:hypothetical protein LPTSP3_g31030 [Leptospira kobayashii]|uniref:Lipoprotein n=1 Tax=Leptospira kobayashii TaxID=1917830 RepID=A0ABM7UTF8_9LEPT|nr:hypothetical protein [Leptospira kobayashii]BDA80173.1 hypothetical protein LPTSP3_g31030 [Leptospira kobayashii]
MRNFSIIIAIVCSILISACRTNGQIKSNYPSYKISSDGKGAKIEINIENETANPLLQNQNIQTIIVQKENIKTNFKIIEDRYRPTLDKAINLVETKELYAFWMRIAGRASSVVGGSTAAATAQSNPVTATIAGAVAGIGALAQWLLGDEKFQEDANKCKPLANLKIELDNFITKWEIYENDSGLTQDVFKLLLKDLESLLSQIKSSYEMCYN